MYLVNKAHFTFVLDHNDCLSQESLFLNLVSSPAQCFIFRLVERGQNSEKQLAGSFISYPATACFI
jgi:hypothetical protein